MWVLLPSINVHVLTLAVFRSAHDSAKGVRTWMADLQNK